MTKLLLVFVLSIGITAIAFGQTSTASPSPKLLAPLTGEEVVKRMVQRNLERSNALRSFQATRTYRLEYRGFPGNREAEMVTNIVYQAPDSKEFNVVSQNGSKIIIDRVLRKLLESEQEAMKAENRARTALNTDNYTFQLTGYETSGWDANYVFQVEAKNPSKFVYRGKIWVDAKDFAVSRMQVEPAKSPSFWTKQTEIEHTYAKVEGFWLPKQNRSVSTIRLGGQATLTIDYSSYKIRDPLATAPSSHLTHLTTATHQP